MGTTKTKLTGISKWLLFLLSFSFCSLSSAEGFTPELHQEAQSLVEQKSIKNMKGWDGITFMCIHDGSQFLENVCQRVNIDIELLGISNKIKIHIFQNGKYFGNEFAHSDGAVKLKYRFQSSGGETPAAVIGTLSFLASFDDKVNNRGIGTYERNGDLILWDTAFVASGGNQHELLSAVTSEARLQTKRAILHFIKYND